MKFKTKDLAVRVVGEGKGRIKMILHAEDCPDCTIPTCPDGDTGGCDDNTTEEQDLFRGEICETRGGLLTEIMTFHLKQLGELIEDSKAVEDREAVSVKGE